jgi:hypothetical protein
MLIDALVCRADGTQAIEQREVADNWFMPMENTNIQMERTPLFVEYGCDPAKCFSAFVGDKDVSVEEIDLQTENDNASVGEIGGPVGNGSISESENSASAETNCVKPDENQT